MRHFTVLHSEIAGECPWLSIPMPMMTGRGTNLTMPLPCSQPITARSAHSSSNMRTGFDHGVGHSLLLLYDAKTPHGQKIKEFNGLAYDLFNTSTSLF